MIVKLQSNGRWAFCIIVFQKVPSNKASRWQILECRVVTQDTQYRSTPSPLQPSPPSPPPLGGGGIHMPQKA